MLVVGGCHRSLELDALRLEAVRAVRLARGEPLLAACMCGVGIHAQEHCHSGHARADHELHQILDDFQPESARRALVGRGRVDEAVAHDVAPLAERGLDHALHEIRASGREEEQLGHVAHLQRGILEQRADALCHLGAAGLADQEGVRAERLGKQRRLGRLARPVDALEGDEHGAESTRP